MSKPGRPTKQVKFRVYDVDELIQMSIPFIVNGKLNPSICDTPGVYFLLGCGAEGDDLEVLYVGKAIDILARVRTYMHDTQFTRIAWHELNVHGWTLETFEAVYIWELDPVLNGSYHATRQPDKPFRMTAAKAKHDRRLTRLTLNEARKYRIVPAEFRGLWDKPTEIHTSPFDDDVA